VEAAVEVPYPSVPAGGVDLRVLRALSGGGRGAHRSSKPPSRFFPAAAVCLPPGKARQRDERSYETRLELLEALDS
jgi:hypothetical protein